MPDIALFTKEESTVSVNRVPDYCPTHRGAVEPALQYAKQTLDEKHVETVYQCPKHSCPSLFIAY